MGLGKTLTMIALAATDLDTDMNGEADMEVDEEDKTHVLATLIIIPPPRRFIGMLAVPLRGNTC